MYLIYPEGPSVPVPVFCDMTTEGGKWTVSGRREAAQFWSQHVPRLHLGEPQFLHLCPHGIVCNHTANTDYSYPGV